MSTSGRLLPDNSDSLCQIKSGLIQFFNSICPQPASAINSPASDTTMVASFRSIEGGKFLFQFNGAVVHHRDTLFAQVRQKLLQTHPGQFGGAGRGHLPGLEQADGQDGVHAGLEQLIRKRYSHEQRPTVAVTSDRRPSSASRHRLLERSRSSRIVNVRMADPQSVFRLGSRSCLAGRDRGLPLMEVTPCNVKYPLFILEKFCSRTGLNLWESANTHWPRPLTCHVGALTRSCKATAPSRPIPLRGWSLTRTSAQ